ncbi:GGDEF domain-containing protein [Pararhizobium sp. IMCC21322]|uniref:GGDEF domain-containing protein n=1 Tax=Pararhizobium sp. IMCC21322 TaxID=3067903 RepID=UPI002741B5E4|nr:GGDEF domain-containing protein [Pararhizobium sp. IMCC21322]
MAEHEDFRRTLVHGEAALKQIKRCEVPAFPRHYELWYTYSAGFDQKLNTAINEILRTRGKVTLEETTYLYDTFLSPFRLGDKLDQFGSNFSDQIETMLGSIGQSMEVNDDYSTTLSELSSELGAAKNAGAVKNVIHQLVKATAVVRASHKEMEDQLKESQSQVAELKDNLEAARFENLTDELTGLGNRRLFDQTMTRKVQASSGIGTTFCLIMLDIDHFKQFNDTWGHQTGDQVLRLVGMTIKNSISALNIAARYGGEEFAVIMPDTTLDEAIMQADHIREAIKDRKLLKRSTGEKLGNVTVSAGVARYEQADTAMTLIERADAALYSAKRAGRNCVMSEKGDFDEDRMVS